MSDHESQIVSVIPCVPGWRAVHAWPTEEGEIEWDALPVVAWGLQRWGGGREELVGFVLDPVSHHLEPVCREAFPPLREPTCVGYLQPGDGEPSEEWVARQYRELVKVAAVRERLAERTP